MINQNNGEISVFNPSKDIAREVTLNVIIRHRDATTQAREGIILGEEEPNDNRKKINKVKGLYKIISAQRDMINISRPNVLHNCMFKWNRKNNTDEKQLENPFEKEKNEYNELMEIKEILVEAEKDMINAEQTKTLKDDYLIEKTVDNCKKFVLTEKYFEMINGLEDLFEKIYLIMLKHKIVSAGIDQDEIRTYKEDEEAAIKRIVEA